MTNIFGADHITIYCLLLLFGIGFNYLVAEIERRKIQGWTWTAVAFGVGVIELASGFLIGWPAAFVLAICTAAAGVPMAAGAQLRHEKKRKAELERLKQL